MYVIGLSTVLLRGILPIFNPEALHPVITFVFDSVGPQVLMRHLGFTEVVNVADLSEEGRHLLVTFPGGAAEGVVW